MHCEVLDMRREESLPLFHVDYVSRCLVLQIVGAVTAVLAFSSVPPLLLSRAVNLFLISHLSPGHP